MEIDSEEQLIIVDIEDNIVSYVERKKVTQDDIFRITVVWIEDGKGNVLIHRRATEKKIMPNRWENAAGGGVSRGETYEQNAYKELEEELGIKNIKLQFITKNIIPTNNNGLMCSWFKGYCNTPIEKLVLAEREVAEAKWVDKNWLFDDRDKNPDKYMPSSTYWRELFSN